MLNIGEDLALFALKVGEGIAPVFVKSDQGRTVLADAEPLINLLSEIVIARIEAKQAAKQGAKE